MELPLAYINEMKALLGEEYEAYGLLSGYEPILECSGKGGVFAGHEAGF